MRGEFEDYDDRAELNDEDYHLHHIDFANKGSSLRAASKTNPRNLPCPTCGEPNRLTPKDKRLGYQCDSCADIEEGIGGY